MIKKLFIIFIIIGSLYLISCKKKNLDYMYVGIYIEVLDDQNKTMDDRNIKLYYNKHTNVLENTNHIYEYRLITESITKNIKEDDKQVNYDFSAFYSIICDLEEMNVYPIILKDEQYQVLESEAKKIKLELDHLKSITFTKKYRFDDKDYYFKTIIKVLKKEG